MLDRSYLTRIALTEVLNHKWVTDGPKSTPIQIQSEMTRYNDSEEIINSYLNFDGISQYVKFTNYTTVIYTKLPILAEALAVLKFECVKRELFFEITNHTALIKTKTNNVKIEFKSDGTQVVGVMTRITGDYIDFMNVYIELADVYIKNN